MPNLGPARETGDPYDLERFVRAQEHDHARALAEIGSGRKRSHWMWCIFPQLAGLGSSAMAARFGISGTAEAAAYLDHITSPEAMTGLEEAGVLPVYGAGEAPAEGPEADVLEAWGAANEQGAIVPYLDYATPDFYDLLTAQVTDLLAGSQPPDAFLSTLEEEYTSFTSSGG